VATPFIAGRVSEPLLRDVELLRGATLFTGTNFSGSAQVPLMLRGAEAVLHMKHETGLAEALLRGA
jgi:hypothetical protein